MTVSEARAVNRLLTWIVGREPYPLHVPLPTDDDALRAAGYLADRASKALMAGWDGERLSPAWRTRPAPQPTSPTSSTPRRTDMAGRIVPEPPQPNRDPERLAEERELARSAHLAGLAVQRAADLGRLLGGQQPDHSTLDQLDHLADTLKGWGLRTAFGVAADTADSDLLAELTGRRWTPIRSLDDVARLWRRQHPDPGEDPRR